MVPCHRRIFNGLHKQHKNSFPCDPFSPYNVEISYYYRIVIHTGPSPISILTFLELAPGQIHFAFTAHYLGVRAGVARGESGRLQRRAGLGVVESKQLMVLVHILYSNELILSASVTY